MYLGARHENLSATDYYGRCIAGVFIIHDCHRSYLLHTWQKSQVPRGTMTLLINEALKYTIKTLKLKELDLEGSVIKKIDYFLQD